MRGITQALRTGRGPERRRSQHCKPARCIRWPGENGAGKSTLVKILAGIHQPDSGQILKDGERYPILGAADAQRHGIAVVHQHPALFPDLSVAENIFVGRQPKRRGRVDWAAMTSRARETCCDSLRMEIDVRLPVKMLTIAERQSIEIARALSLDARVLVMDEPTSAISGREVERLFEIVEHLKKQGVAILFISHFIDEILGWGDEVTILRSGKRVVTRPTAELTPGADRAPHDRHRAGRLLPQGRRQDRRAGAQRPRPLRRRLRRQMSASSCAPARSSASSAWSAPAARRSPRCSSASPAATAAKSGWTAASSIPRSPREAMRLGISFLPEDRHQQGLVLQFPIRANETLPVLRQLCGKLGLVDGAKESEIAADFAKRMRVVATGVEQVTSTLSGGNQQKVLLAKWLIPGAAGPHPRPADARHRRRRQGRDPPHRLAPRRRRESPSS